MEDQSYEFAVDGEVIKMIHGELPAVRWTCGKCGDDACTIFYEPEAKEIAVACESCKASNLVRIC
jgi:predicted RNA-binding protein with PUA domain